MKFLYSVFILSLLITFTQCTPEDELSSALDGEYTGTVTAEWERMDIKNFDTNPDTTYYSNNHTAEFELSIQASTYIFPSYDELVSGSLLVEKDSLTFGEALPDCEFISDCDYFLAGEKVRYELNGNELSLFFSVDWTERQYNFTDKDFSRGSRVYDLVKN